MQYRFILPIENKKTTKSNENKKKFDLGLEEDENLKKLNEIARKQVRVAMLQYTTIFRFLL